MFSLPRLSVVAPAAVLFSAAVVSAQDPNSMSRVININSVTDFCVYAPPNGGGVADFESSVVSYCTKSGYGTRLIPQGTITGAHFVKTPHYVQVTGNGDFTKIGITPGDQGGELDPHGAEGTGNPVGGVVYTNNVQTPEWMHFMSATDFCFRACFPGNRATSLCRHTYDVLGCGFNMPGNYASGVFEECDGNDAQDIMYNYPGLATFQQDDTSRGVAVPSPHPAPASYNCKFTDAAALGGAGTPGGSGAGRTTSSSSPSTSSTSSSTASSTSSSSSSSSSSTSTVTSSATITSTLSSSSSSSSTPTTLTTSVAVQEVTASPLTNNRTPDAAFSSTQGASAFAAAALAACVGAAVVLL